MIVSIGMRVIDRCLRIDCEPYVGVQDQAFDDQQQAQESVDQDKYNLGLSLLHIHNWYNHMHVSILTILAKS